MNYMFCPIERARVFQGRTWSPCVLLDSCPYVDRTPIRWVEDLFTGVTEADDVLWPMVKATSDEEWHIRPVRPERDSGDMDRISAELNEFGETAMYFSGERPIFITRDYIELKVDGKTIASDYQVTDPDDDEELQRVADLLGVSAKSIHIEAHYEETDVLSWVPVSRPQGGTRCPLYKPRKREAVIGKRMYHKQWGIVTAVFDPDGKKATVVKTGHITKRVLVSHLRSL